MLFMKRRIQPMVDSFLLLLNTRMLVFFLQLCYAVYAAGSRG